MSAGGWGLAAPSGIHLVEIYLGRGRPAGDRSPAGWWTGRGKTGRGKC